MKAACALVAPTVYIWTLLEYRQRRVYHSVSVFVWGIPWRKLYPRNILNFPLLKPRQICMWYIPGTSINNLSHSWCVFLFVCYQYIDGDGIPLFSLVLRAPGTWVLLAVRIYCVQLWWAYLLLSVRYINGTQHCWRIIFLFSCQHWRKQNRRETNAGKPRTVHTTNQYLVYDIGV